MFEGTRKDGKLDGLSTTWVENGQKKLEETYKDGKRRWITYLVVREWREKK